MDAQTLSVTRKFSNYQTGEVTTITEAPIYPLPQIQVRAPTLDRYEPTSRPTTGNGDMIRRGLPVLVGLGALWLLFSLKKD